MDQDKHIDESWKDSVAGEKEKKDEELKAQPQSESARQPKEGDGQKEDYEEFDFLSYISSLAFQAMIFLGEIPNPMTNKTEKNLRQAKFIIDTLTILKQKTSGNLTKEENDTLEASLYELQMRYVELFTEGKTP